jgi:UDP-N-acetylglucosamine transferase subunit ALG13
MGHTTRCIPIITYIRALGHTPIVAGNSSQLAFLKESIPGIQTTYLDGYNIRYSGANRFLQLGLLKQMPGIFKTISAEHLWLERMADELQLHGIISDNRYGLHHSRVPSVIITHQLQVLSGLGKMADKVVQKMHYSLLNQFGATWVADAPDTPNLAGQLSHTKRLPNSSKYIGLLSRFADSPITDASSGPLLILLSGPEPMRTTLATLLWQQAAAHNGPVVFAEGSDTAIPPADVPSHITYYKRLGGDELQRHLAVASMVVCRSGYSTLMDLVALGKRAIVIPTLGQTEQEYLGRSLHKQGLFYCAAQKSFDLDEALRAAATFPFCSPSLRSAFHLHQPVIADWLSTL